MKYSQLESAILHTYASDVDLFAPCENMSFEEIWQEKSNQVIFRIIKTNHAKKAKTDLHLLRDGLFKAGYDKADITTILQNFKNSDGSIKSNIKAHMEVVFDMYSRRIMKPIIHRAYNNLFSNNGDIEENVGFIKDVFNDLDSIKNNLSVDKGVLDIFDEAYKEFEDAQNSTKEVIGYESGLKDLDKITCGLKQEIIVIGASPGMGKSTLMVTLMDNVAVKENAPLIVFSLEMPATQLMKNLWANDLEINSWKIRSGNADEEESKRIKNFRSRLKSNLMIDDTAGITWQYIETKIRRIRRTIPMSTVIVVMVDYLQLMRNIPEETRGMSKEEQIAARCNGLQELSKKYNLCMIELSQLTKESSREKRAPVLADLKESGAIEANAVQVWFLFRPDYHEREPKDDNGADLRGLCEINVAKNRYGETKPVYVKFTGKYSSFSNRDMSGEIQSGNEEF